MPHWDKLRCLKAKSDGPRAEGGTQLLDALVNVVPLFVGVVDSPPEVFARLADVYDRDAHIA